MASKSASGGFNDDEKTLTVRLFGSHEAAEIAAANLNTHGIRCWVSADDCSGMYPNLTTAAGVRLNVRAVDAAAATALLDAQPTPDEINQLEKEALASVPEEKSPPKKLAWMQILISLVVGLYLGILLMGRNNPGNNTYYSYTADGKCNEAEIYRRGRLVQVCRDENLDGKWDAWYYYKNDEVVRVEYDNNFDGKPDGRTIYSNGSPATAERDTDFNGVPDAFCTYSNGIISQIDIRPNRSEITTTREIFQNGVLTEILRNGDSNGRFIHRTRYDPFLNPIGTNQPPGFP